VAETCPRCGDTHYPKTLGVEAICSTCRYHDSEDNPIIKLAENAVRCYAGDVDRETAEQTLPLWQYYGDLSVRERRRVLERFPRTNIVETNSGPGAW